MPGGGTSASIAPSPATGRPGGAEAWRLGLDHAEAQRRLADYGPNALPGGERKPLYRIVLKVLAEPMFLMLLVAGMIYLALGDRAEAAFLLGSISVVIGITLFQEQRTQRTLETLRDLSAPRALVIRDGRKLRVHGREVVPGDLLALHEGDRISADAVLLEGELEVDESLLTGEAIAVTRAAGSDRNSVHASTVVTRGVALARVSCTGTATKVGQIGAMLISAHEPVSGLQRSSRKLIKGLSAIALLLAIGYCLLNWLWNAQTFLDSLLASIALCMAILPEEIPVILAVFLAMGAWRLSRHRVLTRNIPAVEALGATTVLAVDKTGTLTQNRMRIVTLVPAGGTPENTSVEQAASLPPGTEALVECALLATPPDPFDPMETAIVAFGERLGTAQRTHPGWTLLRGYALSSETLATTRAYAVHGQTAVRLATKGAPESIVALCRLPPDQAAAILAQAAGLAARGLRVLGVACGKWSSGSDLPQRQQDFSFEFAGLLGFGDPPRADAPAAIAECREAGIRVLMLTGDHPATAQAIAREIGLSTRADVLTGKGIAQLDDAALVGRLRQADICARLRPEQKLRLVRLLQQSGEVVAMTGDGVNDAPALKAADVGVAMGERGTDVARESAALVLLDDSFASIVRAIRQGRRIYDNIGKATGFVFAVHVPIIVLALLPALLHWPPILAPIHIVLLELLIDPASSMVFEAEPESPGLMRRPPRARTHTPFATGRIAYAMLEGTGVAALLIAGCATLLRQGSSVEQVRTATFVGLMVALFLFALANGSTGSFRGRRRSPLLKWMLLAIVACLAVAIGFRPLRALMGFAPPDPHVAMVTGAMILAPGMWLAMLKATVRRWRPRASEAPGR